MLWAISLHWITSGCSRKGNLLYLSYSARDSGPLPLHNTGFDKKFTNLNQKQIQCIEGKILQSKTVKTQWGMIKLPKCVI